jgi:hypothetical protein
LAFESGVDEAIPPLADGLIRDAQAFSDLDILEAPAALEDDARALSESNAVVSLPCQSLQLSLFFGRQN